MTVGLLMTQQEVAARLRRSVKSIARLREAGELAYLPGSPIMIPASEVDDYLARKMVTREEKQVENHAERDKALIRRADLIVAKMKAKGQLAGVAELLRKTRAAK